VGYVITHADLDKDQDLIVSLWQRNFEGSPPGRYEWIYNNNPYGKPTTFLLKDVESDSIVGSYSLFPRRLMLNGQYVDSYICGDLVVDTKHRSLGPAIMLIKAALKKSEEDNSVLFGFPNHLSGPVLIMSGFKDISPRFSMTKVLKAEYLLKRHMPALLARLVSYPLDCFLLLRYGLSSDSRYRSESKNSFDERFQEFNNQTIKHYKIKGEINSDYLNWRFCQSPYEKYFIYTLLDKSDNSLKAFIVYSKTGNRASVVDMAMASPDYSEADALFSSFHRFLKKEGIESVSTDFAGDNALMEKLIKNGFSVRSKDLKTILYLPKAKKDELPDIMTGHWYLSAADNDI
jgi:hypothetical protein